MPSLLTSALKNKIFWYMASRYGTFAIQFLTSIWLAVKLGPYYFGLWSFILLLVNIGSQFNFGIANAINILLVQNKNNEGVCKAYEYNGFLLTLAISIVPLAIAVWDSFWPIHLFAKYNLGCFSYAVAFIVICFHLNSLCINVFRVKNRLLEIAISQSLFPLVSFALVTLISGRALLCWLVIGYALSVFLSLLLFLRLKLVSTHGGASGVVMVEISSKGFYLFLYNACFLLTMLSTKMLISTYYPVETFGQFAFAFNVSNATILLIDSLMFLLFPKMIDVMRGSDTLCIWKKVSMMRDCYIFTMNILFYFMIGAFGVLIRFLPKYEASYPIFIAIALTMLVYIWCFGYAIYMLAQNNERIMAAFSGGMLVLNVALVWLLIKFMHVNVETCLVGTAVAYFAYVLCVNGFSRRRLGVLSKWNVDCLYVCRLGVIPAVMALLFLHCNLAIWMPSILVIIMILNTKTVMRFIEQVKCLIVKPQIMNV